MNYLAIVLLLSTLGSDDARTTERLYYSCSNDIGRRDITLFANGTVRLREGLWDDQQLYLEELGPEELRGYVDILEEIHDSDEWSLTGRLPIGGAWVDRCELRLELEDKEPLEFRYSAYEVPPLIVSRIVHLAEDLAETTRPPDNVDRLPYDYKPKRGHLLTSIDGHRFRVLRLTSDGRAVELQGLDQPVRIYVLLSELSDAFVSYEDPTKR